MTTNQQIRFRVWEMPCCKTTICWINERIPNNCPECGAKSYQKLKFETVPILDTRDAWLKIRDHFELKTMKRANELERERK